MINFVTKLRGHRFQFCYTSHKLLYLLACLSWPKKQFFCMLRVYNWAVEWTIPKLEALFRFSASQNLSSSQIRSTSRFFFLTRNHQCFSTHILYMILISSALSDSRLAQKNLYKKEIKQVHPLTLVSSPYMNATYRIFYLCQSYELMRSTFDSYTLFLYNFFSKWDKWI